MTPRLQVELEFLRQRIQSMDCIEEPSRVIIQIHSYKLPSGWLPPTVELAFIVPAGYPVTPPDNFFVKPVLRVATNTMPSNYNDDGTGNGMPGWAFFSFHMQDANGVLTWSPTNDPSVGDNLLTYYRAIGDRLREVN